MCGIAGWHNANRGQDELRGMMDRLAHRGPDGQGLAIGDGYGLGHRRLTILDAAGGHQPMQSVSGHSTILFNGLIYNHAELRTELERQGSRFASHHSDTETLLNLLETTGPSGLSRVDGMFALAFLDHRNGSLLLARDRFGVKPLHVARLPEGGIAFASELKAFGALADFPLQLDAQALTEWAVFEYPLDPKTTILAGVDNLLPGTWIHYARDGTSTAGNIGIHLSLIARANRTVGIEAIDEELRQSVNSRLESDVPLGVLLSGGLDSSLVASHAANQLAAQGQELRTISAADDETNPDLQAARSVADALGTQHHEVLFTPKEAWNRVPAFLWHGEMPNLDEIFFDPLFAGAKSDFTVTLCGQGSDELWAGYRRYKDPGAAVAQWRKHLKANSIAPTPRIEAHLAEAAQGALQLAALDQRAQLSNFQMRLVDRHAMAHAIEVREPFLSPGIVHLARQTPIRDKLAHGTEKWVLRQSARASGRHRLPRVILERPKLPAGTSTAPATLALLRERARQFTQRRPRVLLDLPFVPAAPLHAMGVALLHHLLVERRGAPLQAGSTDTILESLT